jgi:hypothetical protein
MESKPSSRLGLPAAEAFPPTDATLPQIIRFAQSVDPTVRFRECWGRNYEANGRALWDRCVQSWQASSADLDRCGQVVDRSADLRFKVRGF